MKTKIIIEIAKELIFVVIALCVFYNCCPGCGDKADADTGSHTVTSPLDGQKRIIILL